MFVKLEKKRVAAESSFFVLTALFCFRFNIGYIFLLIRRLGVRAEDRQHVAQVLVLSGHPDEFPAEQRRLRRRAGSLDGPLVGHGSARVAVPLVPETVHALFEVSQLEVGRPNVSAAVGLHVAFQASAVKVRLGTQVPFFFSL